MSNNPPILEAEDLTVQYKTNAGMLTAVSNVSFSISEGEYFGLVGESGCGKSTIIDAVLGTLDKNGRITSGKVRYKGKEIQSMSDEELSKKIRGKEIGIIPQASLNSLDPLQRIDKHALQLAKVHTELSREEALERFSDMMAVVGLQENRIKDYPHQFSGGMRQRTMIALSLFLEPSLLIADEPTTALDVIMQDQVFNYLDDLRETDTSLMLITHDISLVFESCDSIGVMHAGQLCESGGAKELFVNPRHPYTIMLQEAFPDIRFLDQELGVIEGAPPQTIGDVDYCAFADRCPWAVEDCRYDAPAFESIKPEFEGIERSVQAPHSVACIRKDEIHELYEANETFDQKQVGE
jgi:oligopeptide/dipeptide ABC transporter ATP-binding protein